MTAARMVEQFVVYFYKHICDGHLKDIDTMYTLTFNKISADFFPDSPWPPHEALRTYVQDDLFWVLYQELYYRHLHSLGKKRRDLLTFEHRKGSWDNYVELFRVLQTRKTSMKLPNIWLWDMVDDFLYQFQSFTSLKGQVSERTTSELEFLQRNPDVWHPEKVQQILEALVAKSDIRAAIAADNGRRLYESDGLDAPPVATPAAPARAATAAAPSGSNVVRMLGYFSLVGLCRYHCLTGAHEEALRALAPLNPFVRQHLLTFKIPLANINLFYYAGMSYLMLRRYIDAARCFNAILSYILRVKAQHRDSTAYEQILGKNEQLYQLLAICVAMCPAAARWVEDPVREQLRSKAANDMSKMASGDIEAFKRAFGLGCARFVTTAPPDLSGGTDNGRSGFQAQLRLFVAEADAAHQLPDLKRYLRLYTSVSTEKLAALLQTAPATLLGVLRDMQARAVQRRWVTGDAAAGEDVTVADVEFEIRKEGSVDMVVVREQHAPANHAATLAKHIMRFEQITRDMEVHVQPVAVLAGAAR